MSEAILDAVRWLTQTGELERLTALHAEVLRGDGDLAKRDACDNCHALGWRHTEAAASNGHSLTRVCGHCGRVEYFSFGVDGWEAVHYQGKDAAGDTGGNK